MLPSNVVIFHHGQRWTPRCCVPSWGHNTFLLVLRVLFLLLMSKYYAIFSYPTIFFCFTLELDAMEFSELVVRWVQSQPHMGTDVVVEPRRHVKTNKTMVDQNVFSLSRFLYAESKAGIYKSQQLVRGGSRELIQEKYSLYDPGTKQQETENFLLTTHGGIAGNFHSFHISDARCPIVHKILSGR